MNAAKQLQRQETLPTVPAPAATPAALLEIAITNGADIEKLEKLMAMQERYEANEARKAFLADMNAFRAEAIVVYKDADGHNSKYAKLSSIVKHVVPIMAKHNLTHRWITESVDGGTVVTCVLTHELGHSEQASMTAPPETSGSKNAIQAIGSTISYLQRYTFQAVTGIVASDDDNDAVVYDVEYISESLAAKVRDRLEATDSNVEKFLEVFKVESIEMIPASKYQRINKALKAKESKQ